MGIESCALFIDCLFFRGLDGLGDAVFLLLDLFTNVVLLLILFHNVGFYVILGLDALRLEFHTVFLFPLPHVVLVS